MQEVRKRIGGREPKMENEKAQEKRWREPFLYECMYVRESVSVRAHIDFCQNPMGQDSNTTNNHR